MSKLKQQRSRYLLAVSPLALALVAASGQAANRVDLQRKDVAQLNRQYTAVSAAVGRPAVAGDRHAELLGLGAESTLSLVKATEPVKGVTNRRYVQHFRGIPIFGESIVVSEDANGNVRTLFGRMVTELEREVSAVAPGIPSSQAVAIAKRARLGSGLASRVVQGERSRQMIYIDDSGRARLSHVVSFFADARKGGAPTSPVVIVDARTGAILKQWDALANAEIGTGPGGNEKTGQYEYGNDYGYLDVAQSGSTCVMESDKVKTVNLNHGTSGNTAYSYACPRNTVKSINGAYSPLNDAHYFGHVVFDMYSDYLGAAPLTNKVTLKAHYSSNYENAFWDPNTQTMSFGDGANRYYPLVSLDVLSHEVSHGYTNQNSDLIYSGQSGGINEAFSDISAEAAEDFSRGEADFMIGAEIFKADGALRYMDDPTRDGASIGHADDYYNGMNVHLSSGVYNKAFYTLVHSGGWTTKDAFLAFARANRDYWTPSTNFDQGSCGVGQAAIDMGKNVDDVIAAFDVVGVSTAGCAFDGGGGGDNQAPTAGFSASANGLTVAFTDASSDSDGSIASRSWNFGDGSSSAETSPSHTYAAAGQYTVTLTVTDNEGVTDTESKTVTVSDEGGGGDEPQTYSNTTDYQIRDFSIVESPITITGRQGNAGYTEVTVDIRHTARGDLKVDVVAPDGTTYNLVNRTGGSTDNVQGKYVGTLSTETKNGTWKLRVVDYGWFDSGYINSWSIRF